MTKCREALYFFVNHYGKFRNLISSKVEERWELFYSISIVGISRHFLHKRKPPANEVGGRQSLRDQLIDTCFVVVLFLLESAIL